MGHKTGVGLALLFAAATLCFASPTFAGSVSYSYDALGRVTSATYSNGTTITYAYDAAGNRTQQQVTGSTSAPNANAVSATVAYNSSNDPITLNITGGAPTSVSVSTQALHGAAAASGTTISYTPTSGYAGADSFRYTATNSFGTSSPANVSVTVSNAAPVAHAVSATVPWDSADNPIALNVTGGPATSVAVSTQASHGAAAASGAAITYTPNGGYQGADSFAYTASNATGTSSPATASITVNIAPPIANAVSQTVAGNSSNNTITLSFSDGTPTSVAVSTQASNGTATASGTTIKYTPNSGYYGPDSFQYTGTNAGGTSSPATVTITVTPAAGTVLYTNSTPGSWSYTIPAGVSHAKVEAWGGGGDGGITVPAVNGQASGGGAGGYTESDVAVTTNEVFSGTIGAGGAANPPSNIGLPGGTTTVSSLTGPPTANGGQPAYPGGGDGGAGGTASGGQINKTGGAGGGLGSPGVPYTILSGNVGYGGSGNPRTNGGNGGIRITAENN